MLTESQTFPNYPYGRFYARSEKHLTDRLNEVVGKGRWMKTKRMIDTYGQYRNTPDKADKPMFAEADDCGGWKYSTQVYRGVIFQDDAAAALAKMFIPGVDGHEPGEMVILRGFTTAVINPKARYYGFTPSGMLWEDKAVAAAEHRAAYLATYPNALYRP